MEGITIMTSMTQDNSQQVTQEDEDFDFVAKERVTKTQPECPPWCEVSREAHEAEAHEAQGCWFAHQREVVVGDFANAAVISCQTFEEKIAGNEASSAEGLKPAFFIHVQGDALSAEDALSTAAAITRLVEEVAR